LAHLRKVWWISEKKSGNTDVDHLKHPSVLSSADAKPTSSDLVHAMPGQYAFALSMCML
jgi:hypothetical protein